jgi:hypothetical protein
LAQASVHVLVGGHRASLRLRWREALGAKNDNSRIRHLLILSLKDRPNQNAQAECLCRIAQAEKNRKIGPNDNIAVRQTESRNILIPQYPATELRHSIGIDLRARLTPARGANATASDIWSRRSANGARRITFPQLTVQLPCFGYWKKGQSGVEFRLS